MDSQAAVASPVAVVLLSGGMDSLTAAGLARAEGHELALIHFNYGQKTEEAELRSFHRIADFFEVPPGRRLIAHTNFFAQMGGSALTDRAIEVPAADLDRKGIPPTYVPFRNAVLLSMAAGWAEAIGASAVYYGAVCADSSGYPDCRPSFVEAFNLLIEEGSKAGSALEVRAPLINLSKAEIIRRAVELDLPLQHTWSCYSRNDAACGVCDSCALRLRGFEQAGLQDPIPYARSRASLEEERRRRLESAQRLARLLRALTRPAGP